MSRVTHFIYLVVWEVSAAALLLQSMIDSLPLFSAKKNVESERANSLLRVKFIKSTFEKKTFPRSIRCSHNLV